MIRARTLLIVLVLIAFASGLVSVAVAAPIVVGGYPVRTEGVFTSSSPTYVGLLEIKSKRRLVVSAASQFAMDFGIIPDTDLKKWRRNESPRYLVRFGGQTDTRYISLDAGRYFVVARDVNRGLVPNGYAIKVRRFTAKANDNGRIRNFVSNEVFSENIGARNWNGIQLPVSTNAKQWVDGVFAHGSDQAVEWELLTGPEYQKFRAGLEYENELGGSDPRGLNFQFVPTSGTDYYLIFTNSGPVISSFTVTNELYR